MISISKSSGAGGPKKTSGVGAKRGTKGGFAVSESSPGSSTRTSAPIAEPASASALAALISIQSDHGGNARSKLNAERMLMLLEQIRDGMLSGRIGERDLLDLANAASAKSTDADPRLGEILDDIALRARVELAKFGR